MRINQFVLSSLITLSLLSCKPKTDIQAEVFPQVQVISPKQSSVYQSGEKIPLVIRAVDKNTIDSVAVRVTEDSSSLVIYARTIPVFQTTGNFIDTFTYMPAHNMLVSLDVDVVHAGNKRVPFFSSSFEIRK